VISGAASRNISGDAFLCITIPTENNVATKELSVAPNRAEYRPRQILVMPASEGEAAALGIGWVGEM